jgi:thiamine-phosphate pyrophosphorylase
MELRRKARGGGRTTVYRILDANINRIREGLRVIEECFRFAAVDARFAGRIKRLRHRLRTIEEMLGPRELLAGRDAGADPFGRGMRARERRRRSVAAVCVSSLKRAQEAARVIEEYSKLLVSRGGAPDAAKTIRFSLYILEKDIMERIFDGGEKEKKRGKGK